jgi:acetyl esterase/lipase
VKRTALHYGPGHAQVAELWRPSAGGNRPVVVLIHGGFWRQIYTKRLMHRLAAAVVGQGWVAYNIEYRRVGPFGGGGWPETFEDVAATVEALSDVGGVDHQRIVTCGHSAGGHLALWAGTPRTTSNPVTSTVKVCAAISLAGVVDLAAAASLGLGGGAVEALMGGSPEEVPARYALGSPAAQLPLGIPQFLLHGTVDSAVPASLSAHYVDTAVSLGDDATYLPLPGARHMDMIDPAGLAFHQVAAILARFSAPPA